jgi:metallophosphoesterase (TIGR03767 family)
VCDSQSPGRVEFLDRYADPDSPLRGQVDEVGTYRPQEILTAQVVDAMVHAANSVPAGPVGGAPIDLAVVTGDNTDNAQANELAWYLRLLDGGEIRPDSGDLTRYEGVAATGDDRYWHPEATSDRIQQVYGFPSVPGLLSAARAPFVAPGLAMPWLAVHGNHDRLLQGTLPARGPLSEATTSDRATDTLPADWSPRRIAMFLAALASGSGHPVTTDLARRVTTRAEFISAHHHAAARPPGHGFTRADHAYYRYDLGAVRFITLDTVNHHGGWEGSLDGEQFDWLREQLAVADAEQGYVVLMSHHPLARLVNWRTDGTDRRVLAAEVCRLLDEHPSVVLWLNGHTHQTTISAHGSWWEVTAPSLIDWPQQGRIVELLRYDDATLAVATTMLDHAGEAPWSGDLDRTSALAGLSRELATVRRSSIWRTPSRAAGSPSVGATEIEDDHANDDQRDPDDFDGVYRFVEEDDTDRHDRRRTHR